jgi:hypothetical protein
MTKTSLFEARINYLTLLLKSKQLQIRMDWSIEFFFYNFSYGGHLGPIGCELDWGPSPPRTIIAQNTLEHAQKAYLIDSVFCIFVLYVQVC